MLPFATLQDAWRADVDEVPSPRTLRAQRETLRRGEQDAKLGLLQLLYEYARDDDGQPDEEMQVASTMHAQGPGSRCTCSPAACCLDSHGAHARTRC